jgi:hypothetical protein
LKGQRISHSWWETIINIVVGLLVNATAQFTMFPLLGVKASLNQNIAIVAMFTILAILRQFTLRRIFNWWMLRDMKGRAKV